MRDIDWSDLKTGLGEADGKNPIISPLYKEVWLSVERGKTATTIIITTRGRAFEWAFNKPLLEGWRSRVKSSRDLQEASKNGIELKTSYLWSSGLSVFFLFRDQLVTSLQFVTTLRPACFPLRKTTCVLVLEPPISLGFLWGGTT